MALTKVTFPMLEDAPTLVENFGAVGDGSTDDKVALQAAFDWSKTNKQPVYLSDKRYYTSGTLDVGGAIIRSLSGIPGGADPYYLMKPNGTYVFGSPDYTWYCNTAHGTYTWAQMIADTSYGAAIVSDYNGAILYCSEGVAERFDIENIGVVGYQNKTSQDGLQTAVATSYQGAGQNIQNVFVVGCGRNGIYLQRGFEVSKISNVKLWANNGYGLKVTKQTGIDCPVEYLDFENCQCLNNRLGSVYFDHWRKSINFTSCQFGNEGQYNSPGGVDPVLGYNRTVPVTTSTMAAGVWVNDVSLDIGAGIGLGFSMLECFGEQIAVALHLRGQNSSGVARDLFLQSNSFVRSAAVGTSVSGGGQNGAVYYFDVKYLADWNINATYNQALDYTVFASTPSRDGGVGGIASFESGFPTGLNWYEQGTWTAVVAGGTTAGTYELATNDCRYTRIGRLVNVSAKIVLAGSVTGGGTGILTISGLPFNYPATATSTGGVYGSATLTGIAFTGSYTFVGRVTVSAANTIYFGGVDNAGTITPVLVSAVGTNDAIEFSFSYTV